VNPEGGEIVTVKREDWGLLLKTAALALGAARLIVKIAELLR